ncbi:MAG: uroporphyrinogen-III C-methyltransferase [Candidatus Hydrogenedentota bacterium]|nr:MAG: uroporphyrinogen-III C-methyltransferase [Candidatus Hydrogenedentota bacterium]
MKGKVFLVGAGPGDPSLLTIKALTLLQKADVVLYDSLVSPEVLEFCPTHCQKVHVGKRKGQHSKSQNEINEMMIAFAQKYKTVIRLKGGDPLILGRSGEELSALREANIEAEIVPGVTAASAAASALQIPLTHRHLGQGAIFLSGYSKENPNQDGLPDYDWEALVKNRFTLVFYMGLTNADRIAEKLIAAGMPQETPACFMSHLTLPGERFYFASLKNVKEVLEKEKPKFPALFLVGDILQLSRITQKSTQETKNAVMLLFHGSKQKSNEPESLKTFLENTLMLRTEYGFIGGDFQPNWEESFSTLLAQKPNRIFVIPFFLLPGKHLNKDVPEIIKKMKEKTNAEITLHAQESLLSVIKPLAWEWVRQWQNES